MLVMSEVIWIRFLRDFHSNWCLQWLRQRSLIWTTWIKMMILNYLDSIPADICVSHWWPQQRSASFALKDSHCVIDRRFIVDILKRDKLVSDWHPFMFTYWRKGMLVASDKTIDQSASRMIDHIDQWGTVEVRSTKLYIQLVTESLYSPRSPEYISHVHIY